MCVLCRYTKYVFSETHGVPGVLSVAVDFYAQTDAPKHSCCEPQGGLLCLGKPVKLTVDGVRYCCPRGATEQQPCPNKTFVIESAGEQDGVVAPMDEDLAQPVPTAAAAVATAVEAIEEMAEKEEKVNEEARVTGSCPDLASLRSSRVLAAGFSAAFLFLSSRSDLCADFAAAFFLKPANARGGRVSRAASVFQTTGARWAHRKRT